MGYLILGRQNLTEDQIQKYVFSEKVLPLNSIVSRARKQKENRKIHNIILMRYSSSTMSSSLEKGKKEHVRPGYAKMKSSGGKITVRLFYHPLLLFLH
jgi:hypothetical protein